MRTAALRDARHLLLAATLLATASATLGAQQPAAPDRFAGTWQGTLATPMGRLRLGLTVARDSQGTLAGSLTSIDQGGVKLPATFSVAQDSLVCDVAMAHIHYAAVLSPAGDSLRGRFSQGPGNLPLDMGRVAALTVATAPARPQTPKAPFPYTTTEVSVASVPGVTLAGTLTMPEGAGPFPAVVFVTGSGPQDRDETILGHHPFWIIADHLARHGIASLRYDDRGTAHSTGRFAEATSVDFANDADSAVHFLRTRPGIDAKHVGIIGHSEGGLIAPMVAARDRDVAFIVMLAGPGLPGDSILVLQAIAVATSNGVPAAMAEQGAAANGRIFAAIHGAKDSADADARAHAAFHQLVDSMPPERRTAVTQTFEGSLSTLLNPWMRAFLAYDPRPTLRQVKVPVLALNGTLDVQVPAAADLPQIDAALKAGGNRDYRVVALPGLNHLFQDAKTGSPAEYEKIEETFSPAAMDLITSWILEHSRSR